MASRLYVYYRVSPDHEAAARAAVRTLQARWCQSMATLRCELLRRAEEPGARDITLMETYACDGGITPAWRERIEREAYEQLAAWLIGGRQVEAFEPCA